MPSDRSDRKYLLDASAVLALTGDEPGAEVVVDLLNRSCISLVNLAEVLQFHPANSKIELSELAEWLREAGVEYLPFTEEIAIRAAQLYRDLKSHGLSLADRIALATAQEAGLIVVTADRAWGKLDLAVKIQLIR